MRSHSHLKTAALILDHYKGDEPFASFLKNFFRSNKKYGSTDRKVIGHLCYCYFRLGKSLREVSIEERILAGLFFCSAESNEVLEQLKPEWNQSVALSLKEKCSMLNAQFSILNVFPWKEELSKGIDHKEFCESFFIQPDVYIRLRPGHEKTVRNKLTAAAIEFKDVSPNCLSMTSSTKIDAVLELDKEVVIQDYNSQRTAEFIQSAIFNLPAGREGHKSKIKSWDCCAGSGGKSLLLYDIEPSVEITVSDVRASIIQNLKKRFELAGMRNYNSFVADLTRNQQSATGDFDLIICDAPCTGSGTWGRTPEQLYFFDEKKIGYYSSLQKKIIYHAVPQLKAGGYFLYITCSVFKKENEENVDFIKQQFHLDLVKMELLKGYDKKADSLFAALFRKG